MNELCGQELIIRISRMQRLQRWIKCNSLGIKIGIKKEALDTGKWVSDEELYNAFFTEDNDLVNEFNKTKVD